MAAEPHVDGRLAVMRSGWFRGATAVVAGLCLGAIVFVVVRDGNRAVEAPAPAPVTADLLGAPMSEAPVLVPHKDVSAGIESGGLHVKNGDLSLMLNLIGDGTFGPWRTFAKGAKRKTPFGEQTLVLGMPASEEIGRAHV